MSHPAKEVLLATTNLPRNLSGAALATPIVQSVKGMASRAPRTLPMLLVVLAEGGS